ncbi:hypothetical protein [Sandaracinus amylolyticus]|uniref:hypothetical protein n=1 Tax=Sandaracinus amylolyticus TaxID=927083 RepID=UPI001F1AC9F9|nr:hypothetical protein [Sandaracinus amylolyticus]UJR82713.1 Hypothetical protein I5071_47780 [Sandaracinus amylolyticus]
MIVPLWVAVPALVGAGALGWALDRALRWELDRAGALGWAIRIAAGASVVLAAIVHPLLAIVLGAIFAIERRTARAEARRTPEPSRTGLVVLGVAAAIVALRVPVPLYWDEHVWLAKVRMGVVALRDAALDPAADLIPRGYPIVGSLAEILFAMGRDDVPSMVAGAATLLLLCLALALATMRADRRVGWAIAIAMVPLAWVHARSAYLDLPIGLLALAIAAGLARAERWATCTAVIAAFLVAGCKDEGVVHALAIAGAHVVASRDRRREALRDALLVVAAALVATLGWRVLLVAHGVANRDHALEGAGLARAGALVLELARATCDVRSWGLAWPIAIGAAMASRFVSPRASALAMALTAQVAALFVALLLGGERLTAFALGGTLANRWWMQVLPLAALLVVEVIARRDDSR